MRATLLSSLLLIALLTAATGARAPGPPPGFGQGWYDRALDRAATAGMFGGFSMDQNRVLGAFVEVTVDRVGGSLTDYIAKKAFGDVVVFARVEVANASFAPPQVVGSELALTAPGVAITIHNSPLAAMQAESRIGVNRVTYTLGPGIVAALDGNTATIAGNGLRGGLVALGGAAVSAQGGQLVAAIPVGGLVTFRAHLVAGEGVVGSAEQDALLDALAAGSLAAEDLSVELEGGVAQDTVAYARIDVRVTVVERGVVNVAVDASLPSGRAVALHLHRDVFGATPTPDLTVELDGRILRRAGSAPEALAGPSGAFHAAVSSAGALVIAYVPSFSVHTLVVRLPNALPLSPLGAAELIAVGAAVGTLALAGWAALRRERRNW